MEPHVYATKTEMGEAAAACAAAGIQSAIADKGETNIILATGASQFEMLEALTKADIDWSKVTVFHLDEYVGLPMTHPASFHKYLKERFEEQVTGLRAFNYVCGDAPDAAAECARLGELIAQVTIDVACVGIGENGHIAFNDPPADFDTEEPYIVVELDEDCRKQQFGEGWFPTLYDVPSQAISMSVRQIMKSGAIVCTVPDERKARAVKNTFEREVTTEVPATMLRTHAACDMFLDEPAASLLGEKA